MDDYVLLETLCPSGQERLSLLFTEPLAWLECGPDDDPARFLARLDRETDQGRYWAGWFSYEFGSLLEPSLALLPGARERTSPLTRIGIFSGPATYDHRTGRMEGEWPRAEASAGSIEIGSVRPAMTRQGFLDALARIKQYILAGDTYQINFTFALVFELAGSLARLYQQLCANQSVAYAAWLRSRGEDIMSFSPELFFRIDNRTGCITTRPMKGTVRRGRDCAGDARRAAWLRQDGKSRSENVMIVDLLRNDLGRLLHELGGGEVRVESLFDVETYESLLQMTSIISGQAGCGHIPLARAMPALFPCGSVTGAPKIRAMEIIGELEQGPRGVYCGAIGYGGPDGTCLNVPIRTLTLANGRGTMPVGAGIVHDSNPEDEWEECLLKARFLTSPRPDFRLIETLLWLPASGYHLLAEHLDRLAASARYFAYPFNRQEVAARLTAAARGFGGQSMRVRLLLDRQGRIELTRAAITTVAANGGGSQASLVALADPRMDPDNIFLYHKTTHRPWYDRGREQAQEAGLFDLLYINTREEVTEGTIANCFYRLDSCLYTPPVASGLLPGTLRASLLATGQVRERVLPLAELAQVDELLMGNSVRGLVRVRLEGETGP
jgi:para-aminobenzoate synthetase/4-amino-4-deoxychorismate lyase